MTQACRKPKTGSSIYNALQMMYDAGGSAAFAELRSTLAASNSSMSQLYMRVVDPMVSRGMAMLGDDCLHLLQPGYSFVRSTRGEEATPVPAPDHRAIRCRRNPLRLRTGLADDDLSRLRCRAAIGCTGDGQMIFNVAPTTRKHMRQLDEHKINPANDTLNITVTDEPGAGGANHAYLITGFCTETNPSCAPANWDRNLILFQNGTIPENGVNGVTHEALLAIVADRLRSFQAGPFACKANAQALTHIEEAQHWLQQRTIERMRRGVEGTHTA
jgi:hypothetical protein